MGKGFPLCPSVTSVVEILLDHPRDHSTVKVPLNLILRNDDAAPRLFWHRDDRFLCGELRKEEIDECPRLGPAGCASQAQSQEKYQRLQHVGIPQPRMADMLLLGLAKFPDHGLDFASDLSSNGLVRQVGRLRLVDQAGVHQRLVALRERTDSSNQIAVHERTIGERTIGARTIGASALSQSEAESEDQFLAFVEKLLRNLNVGDLNLGKQSLAIPFARPLILRVRTVRCRVLTRLQQIRTIARAVERHLALLAAALRTDFPVHGRAKPLFFSVLTDRATQVQSLECDYFTTRGPPRVKENHSERSSLCGLGVSAMDMVSRP